MVTRSHGKKIKIKIFTLYEKIVMQFSKVLGPRLELVCLNQKFIPSETNFRKPDVIT